MDPSENPPDTLLGFPVKYVDDLDQKDVEVDHTIPDADISTLTATMGDQLSLRLTHKPTGIFVIGQGSSRTKLWHRLAGRLDELVAHAKADAVRNQ